MQRADHAQRRRSPRRAVQVFMQLPVQLAPLPGFGRVHARHHVRGLRQIGFFQQRNRLAQDPGFQPQPQLEELLHFRARQHRHERAPVGDGVDQSLRAQQAQRLAHRDAADAQLLGEQFLAQRFARRNVARQDAVPQYVGHQFRRGLAHDALRVGVGREECLLTAIASAARGGPACPGQATSNRKPLAADLGGTPGGGTPGMRTLGNPAETRTRGSRKLVAELYWIQNPCPFPITVPDDPVAAFGGVAQEISSSAGIPRRIGSNIK